MAARDGSADRNNFLSLGSSVTRWATLCIALASGCLAADAPRRPNILWLIGENLCHDLGCYGARQVETPNLDRLAAEGVRYTRVFSTNPACAPSRSAFFTGMYQTTTDTHPMRSHRDDDFRLPDGVRPITHRLRDAGYFTANIKTIGDRPVGTGKLDLNFVNEGPVYMSDDWSALKARQPFFAVVNSHEAEYDIYDRQSAKKERVEWVGEREHPRIATPANVTPPPYYPDHPVVREEWARFLNSVSGMDRRIGWVLDRLREDGLEEDTVVIFFGDNGRLEPRGIHWCYDSGLHVPMIVRWPKRIPAPEGMRPGSVDDRVISLIDVTATTLAIAGQSRPALMQGRVFLGDRADPSRQYAFSARDRIDETIQRIRTVRDARYRYIRNFTPGPTFASLNRYKEKCFLTIPLMRALQAQGKLDGPPAALMAMRGPSEELYDTETDPHEIRNLVDSADPAHREALARLRAALETWLIETGDRGLRPEPPEIVAPFEKEMHDWFGTPEWAGGGRMVVAAMLRDAMALDGAHDIEVRDGIGYVAGKGGSLAIVDLGRPTSPKCLWSARDPKAYEDAETVLPLGDGRLLLGARDLFLFDVRDPVAPRQLAAVADRPRVDKINGLVRLGDTVFGANKQGFVVSARIEADTSTVKLSGARDARRLDGLTLPHDVALCGELLVVVDPNGFGEGGKPGRLAVYRVCPEGSGTVLPPDQWQVVGKLEDVQLAGANRVRVAGQFAYVGSALSPEAPKDGRLVANASVVDLSDPSAPRLRGVLAFPDARGPNGLERVGDRVYAAGGQTVQAIDVSDPDKPRETARASLGWILPGGADDLHDLVYRDGFLFVTAQTTDAVVVLRLEER